MTWVPAWRLRQARPKPPPLPRPVLPALVEEFHDKPYVGSSYGESFVGGIPEPTRTVEPFRPPPPPWADLDAGEVQAALSRLNQPAGDQLSALERMKLEAGDVAEPPPFRGIVPATRPLLPAKTAEVSWRDEQNAATARNKLERLEHARKLLAEENTS